ncbi:MAG: hypothetical protein HQM09_05480 [Candidatus Riflebacteria bacterium]|nr:hypothetical protein [Candidatus Riflebacteria bacterium]
MRTAHALSIGTSWAGISLALLVGLLVTGSTSAFAEVTAEMKYLGYSDELASYAVDRLGGTHKVQPTEPTPPAPASADIDESTAVTEQLAELGRSRNMTPATPDTSADVKTRLGNYWGDIASRSSVDSRMLAPEFKKYLKDCINKALVGAGYDIRQLDLIDAPPNLGTPRVRGVVRVTRPLKTKNAYNEIQNNLGEIKQLCITAGTVDGMCFLCELTSFVTEDPRNKYYYEKAVLNP